MGFKVADGHLGCIPSVAPRRYELNLHLAILFDVCLHVVGHFVVEDVFDGDDACSS
jgi:hypothetical protein